MKAVYDVKKNNPDYFIILRNFLLSVLIITGIATLIIATQYSGDKALRQIEGQGFPTVNYEDIKNSCINFFGVLK